jgi:asparagine N-glycosylation enzyme membrane subunit Stt3
LGLVLLLAIGIIWNMFREKDILKQLDAALVLVPLILRLLLIK